MIGQRLGGRYRVIRRVGGGGMGVVYQAEDTLLGRTVAVKVLRPHLADDEAFRKRFEREGRAAASLSHPNIVQIYDVGEGDDGAPYIVMEFVEGRTLERLIAEEGPIPEPVAIGYAGQIASALDEAHRHGIVHRDVKPLNILVTASGTVKVTDFGIARAASGATLVNTGTIIGSAYYVSPEQARGAYVDAKTDVYSLGVVLFEMVTGQAPFQGETPIAVVLKHLQEEAPSPSKLSKISPGLERVILHALEKDPAHRPPSAAAFLQELEEISRPGRRRRRPRSAPLPRHDAGKKEAPAWLGVTVAGIMLLAVGAAYAYTQIGPGAPVRVPPVQGLSLVQAQARLRKVGLGSVVRDRLHSPQVASGKVLETVPPQGSELGRGRLVGLVLSSGPARILVPSLSGMPLAAAVGVLAAHGFSSGEEVHVPDNTYSSGDVVRSDPAAGQRAKAGSAIVLYVSSGPLIRNVAVPPLVGLGFTAAEKVLAHAGLHVEALTWGQGPVAYQVIGQIPSPGTLIPPSRGVTLKVSVGSGGTVPPSPPSQPLEQQSAVVSLPPGVAPGTPVKVMVVDAAGRRLVHRFTVSPGATYPISFSWRGPGSLEVYVNGSLEQRLPLPLLTGVGPSSGQGNSGSGQAGSGPPPSGTTP